MRLQGNISKGKATGMKIFYILLFPVLLGSCANISSYMKHGSFKTDHDLAVMPEAALCGYMNEHEDLRAKIISREKKWNCAADFQHCKNALHIRPNTKEMSVCRKEQKLVHQKLKNPAFGNCIDSGFEVGTQGMASCLAANKREERIRQQEDANELLSRQIEDLEDQNSKNLSAIRDLEDRENRRQFEEKWDMKPY